MQTFLPFPCFVRTSMVLDTPRLFNQVNEALVIASSLLDLYPRTRTGRRGGWPNHPATVMWTGCTFQLMEYAITCLAESIRRGVSVTDELYDRLRTIQELDETPTMPYWIGIDDFHIRHQSNLLRKDYAGYSRIFGRHVPVDLEYAWPGVKPDDYRIGRKSKQSRHDRTALPSRS